MGPSLELASQSIKDDRPASLLGVLLADGDRSVGFGFVVWLLDPVCCCILSKRALHAMPPRLAVATGNERRNRFSTRKQDLGSHTKERDGVRSSTSGGEVGVQGQA